MKHAAMIIKSFAFCVEREQHLAGASNDFFFALVGRLISRRRIGFSEAYFFKLLFRRVLITNCLVETSNLLKTFKRSLTLPYNLF